MVLNTRQQSTRRRNDHKSIIPLLPYRGFQQAFYSVSFFADKAYEEKKKKKKKLVNLCLANGPGIRGSHTNSLPIVSYSGADVHSPRTNIANPHPGERTTAGME
jgi:hypothetical protein